MIRVTGVAPGTIGADLGLQPGTELLAVNGRELEDFLDWEFHTADESFTLHVRQPDGQELEFEVERSLEHPMGVALEPPRVRRCGNRCDFCFVDGNPIGLRDVLYIRDDDYRLSFRYGNFATLTNLKPHDVERIVSYRLSPLYVSVHATDPITRRHLLRNPTAPEILPQLRMLAEHGIEFHTQIVLSAGVNDGPILDASLCDLYELGRAVRSVSVVPVGLTEFSQHDRCREASAAECRITVGQVEAWSSRARAERGFGWVYGADELYLRAGVCLPPPESYDDFEQVENGVGAVRLLQRYVAEAGAAFRTWRGMRIAIVTGTSMGALMPQIAERLREVSGASFEVLPAENTVYGPRVTTAGLLAGRDLVHTLAGRGEFNLALLPGEALNDEGLFIDSMSLDAVAAAVPMPVRLSKTFADALDG